jgi:uncharacterized protein involved in exopolysaccharide biosynthesis
MPEPAGLEAWLHHLRRRWPLIAIACVTASLLAFSVSSLLPKQYRSTASLLIHPPSGSDPRAAVVVSPMYLESLRTYEHLAAADLGFERAVDALGIRDPANPEPIENLKESILRVEVPHNTKILAIHVTLPDPNKAQGLAALLAEQAAERSSSVNAATRDDQSDEMRQAVEAARQRLDQAETNLLKAAQAEPIEGWQAELGALAETRTRLELDRLSRGSATSQNDDRLAAIGGLIARKSALVAAAQVRRQGLETERASAQEDLALARNRLRHTQDPASGHGERLLLIDPGIVPERPVAPNTPLNVIVALLLALVASFVYVTLEFAWHFRQAESRPQPWQAARHG